MLGVLPDKTTVMTLDFKTEGDIIYMIGEARNDISSSEYVYSFHKIKNTPAPHFNLDEEYNIQQAVKVAIKAKVIESAHDISDGGLFVTLAESAIPRNMGFELFTDKNIRKDAFLFGEAQSRVVVSVKKERETDLIQLLKNLEVKFIKLGFVTGSEFKIDNETVLTVADARELYDTALENILK